MKILKRFLIIGSIIFAILIVGISLFWNTLTCVRDVTDDIKFDNITYMALFDQSLPISQIQNEFGVITSGLSQLNCTYEIKNGGATVAPRGKLVYTLRDYDPAFRLAMKDGNKLYLYEAVDNPHAFIGSERYDIEGKVDTIEIYYTDIVERDGPSVIITVTDPKRIEKIVMEIMKASDTDFGLVPVSDIRRPYKLVLNLQDGTNSSISSWPHAAIFGSGLYPAIEFQEIMDQVLNEYSER